MAISVFQVQSPLSQVTRERTNEYLKTVGSAVGEELVRVDLDEFEKAPFALVFVASGGSEGIFKEGYERICKKPCYILTSGESNSLAASMEILSFLKQQGKRGEILHGSVEDVARRINAEDGLRRNRKAEGHAAWRYRRAFRLAYRKRYRRRGVSG